MKLVFFAYFTAHIPFWDGEFEAWIPVPTSSDSVALLKVFARYLYERAITNSLPQ